MTRDILVRGVAAIGPVDFWRAARPRRPTSFRSTRSFCSTQRRCGRESAMPILLRRAKRQCRRSTCGASPCRRVLTISDTAMKIEPGPLPEGFAGDAECRGNAAPERMQADQDLLAVLAQVSGWQRQNEGIVLLGPTDAEIPPQRSLARHHGRTSAHRFDRWRDRRACRRHCVSVPARA